MTYCLRFGILQKPLPEMQPMEQLRVGKTERSIAGVEGLEPPAPGFGDQCSAS